MNHSSSSIDTHGEAECHPDALVRFAAWMTAGDGLAPLLRTWAVCTGVFLVALAIVLLVR
jgi:hypothetical protein